MQPFSIQNPPSVFERKIEIVDQLLEPLQHPTYQPRFFQQPKKSSFIIGAVLLALLAVASHYSRCNVYDTPVCIPPPVGFAFTLLCSVASFMCFVQGCLASESSNLPIPSQNSKFDRYLASRFS